MRTVIAEPGWLALVLEEQADVDDKDQSSNHIYALTLSSNLNTALPQSNENFCIILHSLFKSTCPIPEILSHNPSLKKPLLFSYYIFKLLQI